jgi:hypothetical protein
MAGSAEPLTFTRIWYDFSGSSMAKGARITPTLISGAFSFIPTRESAANGSLPETQSSPEDLHLTGKEGGAEKNCYRGCYEHYYGWEHAQWPLPQAADPAALSCGTAPTNGKRDRHGHLSYGRAAGITRTYHGQAYIWWSRPSRSANASGRPGARAP